MEIYFYILGVFIVIAFYIDVRYHKIPNWLTMSGVIIGALYHLIDRGIHGLLFSILGLIVGAGILLLLYIFKGVGAGDVKLFAAIGAITGMQFALYGMMYSIIFAGIIGVIILLYQREFVQRILNTLFRFIGSLRSKDVKDLEEFKRKEAVRFPFMYAVLPGLLMTFYYFIN